VTSYLLDTHVWLWLQTTPERVRDEALGLLDDRVNRGLVDQWHHVAARGPWGAT
jgi:PIN domain nuclease of toxin-antitoxin system